MTPKTGKTYRISYVPTLPFSFYGLPASEKEKIQEDMYQGLAKCIALDSDEVNGSPLHTFAIITNGKETAEQALFTDEDIVEEITSVHEAQD